MNDSCVKCRLVGGKPLPNKMPKNSQLEEEKETLTGENVASEMGQN